MKSVIVLFIAIFTSCNIVDSVSNGNFVSIEELPYVISLTWFGGYICGGAIISEFYVITAAHCIDTMGIGDPNKIITGRSSFRDGSVYDIEKIYVHGNHFNAKWISLEEDFEDYDVAIIKLKTPIKFDEYQQPIKISSKPLHSGDRVTVCGFGSMGDIKGDSPSLRKSEVTVIDSGEYKLNSKPARVSNSLFCAGNGTTDVCEGDSGSPVIFNGELVGIVSAGPVCNFYPNHDRSPGLYARVDICYDWIMKVTGINQEY